MTKVVSLLGLIGALMVVTTGCGDDGRVTTDSGTSIMDSGMTGDTGTGSDSSTGTDTGTGADTGTADSDVGDPACPPLVVPAPMAPACAAATGTCLETIMSEVEYTACIDADPAPMDCGGCLNQASTSCATMNGCDDEYGAILCCAEGAGCTAENQATCIPANCGGEISAFQSCGGTVGASCTIAGASAICVTPA